MGQRILLIRVGHKGNADPDTLGLSEKGSDIDMDVNFLAIEDLKRLSFHGLQDMESQTVVSNRLPVSSIVQFWCETMEEHRAQKGQARKIIPKVGNECMNKVMRSGSHDHTTARKNSILSVPLIIFWVRLTEADISGQYRMKPSTRMIYVMGHFGEKIKNMHLCEKRGIEHVVFLDSMCMSAAPRAEEKVRHTHFKYILSNASDSNLVHLVSPVFANGHIFFAAIGILDKRELIMQSLGERESNTPLRMYVAKLREYLSIQENKIMLATTSFDLQPKGTNSCAVYALAAIEEYLVRGGTLVNKTKVHEDAARWMVWLRRHQKEMKVYLIRSYKIRISPNTLAAMTGEQ
eukprot:g15792.t1